MQEYNEYKTIMLILTENCNLNCVYCYEHNKTIEDMKFEVAVGIIDEEFSDLDRYEHGAIELFGGEPFINFELIKQLYEYVMTKYSEKHDIVFSTTTNGTLIHGEIQDWLYERRQNFICTLSLDGTPEIHNSNRPMRGGQGSFEHIDIDFFLKTWPNCAAKMTISNRNIFNFADGIKYIESLGFDCLATFASGMDWKVPELKEAMISEMGKLVEYYCNNPEKKLCQMLNMDLRLLFYPLDEDFRYCGAGLRKKCYDIQGNWYPCQGFSPLTVGKSDSKQFCEKDFLSFSISDANKCKACPWIRLCRTCYAANYLETGSIEENSSEMCYINRLCMLASSKIQFKRLVSPEKKYYSDSEKLVLRAIRKIQNNVMNDIIPQIES